MISLLGSLLVELNIADEFVSLVTPANRFRITACGDMFIKPTSITITDIALLRLLVRISLAEEKGI